MLLIHGMCTKHWVNMYTDQFLRIDNILISRLQYAQTRVQSEMQQVTPPTRIICINYNSQSPSDPHHSPRFSIHQGSLSLPHCHCTSWTLTFPFIHTPSFLLVPNVRRSSNHQHREALYIHTDFFLPLFSVTTPNPTSADF